ncbi:MAG: hypothetical protein CVU10_11755 [Bacteroidetes bacterium HGW-Bacteroidetes-5]|jgi:hypothetical protein|nr:MAG: hypothetical protein CVU10_11755 [Bacteroidetes bacterium HGW-Bacteroidetes-5]
MRTFNPKPLNIKFVAQTLKAVIFTAILLISANSSLQAQIRPGMPRVRALLMERQLSEIKKNISIDSRDIPKFDQIYRNYITEVFELNALYEGLVPLETNMDQYSDTQIEENFIKQTDKSKRLLLIREKYFYEFKTIIKPKEIMKLYSIERQVLRQAQQEMRDRVGNRP